MIKMGRDFRILRRDDARVKNGEVERNKRYEQRQVQLRDSAFAARLQRPEGDAATARLLMAADPLDTSWFAEFAHFVNSDAIAAQPVGLSWSLQSWHCPRTSTGTDFLKIYVRDKISVAFDLVAKLPVGYDRSTPFIVKVTMQVVHIPQKGSPSEVGTPKVLYYTPRYDDQSGLLHLSAKDVTLEKPQLKNYKTNNYCFQWDLDPCLNPSGKLRCEEFKFLSERTGRRESEKSQKNSEDADVLPRPSKRQRQSGTNSSNGDEEEEEEGTPNPAVPDSEDPTHHSTAIQQFLEPIIAQQFSPLEQLEEHLLSEFTNLQGKFPSAALLSTPLCILATHPTLRASITFAPPRTPVRDTIRENNMLHLLATVPLAMIEEKAICSLLNSLSRMPDCTADFKKAVLAKNMAGQTPVHNAVYHRKLHVWKLLLEVLDPSERRAIMFRKTASGSTILHIASWRVNVEFLEFVHTNCEELGLQKPDLRTLLNDECFFGRAKCTPRAMAGKDERIVRLLEDLTHTSL
ncbi:hypothetical protein HDU85_005772 [Gaertneriomyces sp. JEL0708]|nr:hypothetical protein HDU85_005772 [Gaertneriomyces sp. JEL0708]